MGFNRMSDVIGIALFEFTGLEWLVGQATRLGAILDATGLRTHGKVIHFALQVRERGVRGLKVKRRALFAQSFGLRVGALRAA
jgi:hypothetical protein